MARVNIVNERDGNRFTIIDKEGLNEDYVIKSIMANGQVKHITIEYNKIVRTLSGTLVTSNKGLYTVTEEFEYDRFYNINNDRHKLGEVVFKSAINGLMQIILPDNVFCFNPLNGKFFQPITFDIEKLLPSSENNDGEAELKVVDGSGKFLYSLNGAPFTLSNVFVGLSSGEHTAIVKNTDNHIEHKKKCFCCKKIIKFLNYL